MVYILLTFLQPNASLLQSDAIFLTVCSGGESEACVQKCTNHCYSDNACDPQTGVCNTVGSSPRCKAGWFGERCDKRKYTICTGLKLAVKNVTAM